MICFINPHGMKDTMNLGGIRITAIITMIITIFSLLTIEGSYKKIGDNTEQYNTNKVGLKPGVYILGMVSMSCTPIKNGKFITDIKLTF